MSENIGFTILEYQPVPRRCGAELAKSTCGLADLGLWHTGLNLHYLKPSTLKSKTLPGNDLAWTCTWVGFANRALRRSAFCCLRGILTQESRDVLMHAHREGKCCDVFRGPTTFAHSFGLPIQKPLKTQTFQGNCARFGCQRHSRPFRAPSLGVQRRLQRPGRGFYFSSRYRFYNGTLCAVYSNQRISSSTALLHWGEKALNKTICSA